MRKILNFSISIMLVLSLILCNVTVVSADETAKKGTEPYQSGALPDTDENQQLSALPDTDETQQPSALPDTDETQQPSVLPDTDETQQPSALPDTDETQQPSALPDTDETQQPSALPDTDETQQPSASPDVKEIQQRNQNKVSVRQVIFNFNDPRGIMRQTTATVGIGKSFTIPTKYNLTQYPAKLIGWSTTDVNGEEETYAGGDSFIMPSKNVIFTGIWENPEDEAKQYTVRYDYNMPVEGEITNNEILVKAGSKVKIDYWPEIPGYKFLGWETEDVEGGRVLYQVTDSFTMPKKDVTLVGVWEEDTSKKEEYTVTYILNPEYTEVYNLSNAGGRTLGDGATYSSQKDCKDKITGFGVVVTEKGQKTADKHVEMSMESDVAGYKGQSPVSYPAGTIISAWDGKNAKVSFSTEIPFGFTSFTKDTEVRIMVTPASKKPAAESYTVKFLDQNGEELADYTTIAEKGSSLTAPVSLPNYYTAEENSKIQVFDKWVPENEGYTVEDLKTITQDMTFKASFKDVTAKWFIRYDGKIQEENGNYTVNVKETVIKDIKPINADGVIDSDTIEEIQKQIISNTYDPSQVPVLTQEVFAQIAAGNDELKDARYEDYKVVWYIFKEGSEGYHVEGILMKNHEGNKGEEANTPSDPSEPSNSSSSSNSSDSSTPNNPSTPSTPEEEVDISEDEIPQAPADAEEVEIENEEIPGGPVMDNEKAPESDSETEVPEEEIPQAPADTLPQTGTTAVVNFYGLGLLLMACGVFFLRKKRAY